MNRATDRTRPPLGCDGPVRDNARSEVRSQMTHPRCTAAQVARPIIPGEKLGRSVTYRRVEDTSRTALERHIGDALPTSACGHYAAPFGRHGAHYFAGYRGVCAGRRRGAPPNQRRVASPVLTCLGPVGGFRARCGNSVRVARATAIIRSRLTDVEPRGAPTHSPQTTIQRRSALSPSDR
jgi:hypothetical protein